MSYGSGPALDGDFDFTIDSVGDVRSSDGTDELQKDLSFNIVRALMYGEGIEQPETVAGSGVIGQPVTDGVLSDIVLATAQVITSDGRVDEIIGITAERSPDDTEYVIIETDLALEDVEENFSFVIPNNT